MQICITGTPSDAQAHCIQDGLLYLMVNLFENSPQKQSWLCWGLEYTDSIFFEWIKNASQKGVLCMMLNCIWLWCPSSGPLGSMEY